MTVQWPWRKLRESDGARLKELERRITELEDDVTSLTEWRVKLLAKLRGQSRAQLATAASGGGGGGGSPAGLEGGGVAREAHNGEGRLTKEQLREFARSRGLSP